MKGERFNSWRTVGSVVAAARVFAMRDVDELMLLDVRATAENRYVLPRLVSEVAAAMQVPLTVGGGVRTLEAFESVLRAGADKVVIGTAALDENFIRACAKRFGVQAVVVAVDVLADGSGAVAVESGSRPTNLTALELATRSVGAGAGEILVQTISRDGTLSGMNLDSIRTVAPAVSVPVIGSGGAASYGDLLAAFKAGADAVAAGAMFQFTEQTPKAARDYLASRGVDVRMAN